jgi:hypothetical protein
LVPTTETGDEETSICNTDNDDFNPLGPPPALASLAIGETHTIPLLFSTTTSSDTNPNEQPLRITRLSRSPDIFLFENFVQFQEQRASLISKARRQGMTLAGTRKSDENMFRKNSYLTWLSANKDDNNDFEAGVEEQDEGGTNQAQDTAQFMTDLAKTLFVHGSLLCSKSPTSSSSEYCTAEDLQIVRYDPGGSFDLHHDGYERFLTVLTYLNGVGGTWFPLAQTSDEADISLMEESRLPVMKIEAETMCSGKVPGIDGLLIVGQEWADSNSKECVAPLDTLSRNIVRIKAGDAVAFYNNKLGQTINADDQTDTKEWRALHCGLAVPDQPKWIATNWFRSEHLTGTFAHLYRQRLLEME